MHSKGAERTRQKRRATAHAWVKAFAIGILTLDTLAIAHAVSPIWPVRPSRRGAYPATREREWSQAAHIRPRDDAAGRGGNGQRAQTVKHGRGEVKGIPASRRTVNRATGAVTAW